VIVSSAQSAQRILNAGKEDAHPQLPKRFSVLELSSFVKLKHIHQFKGFFTFTLKYCSPSLLDPAWIWIFEGKSPATAPHSDKMLPLRYQELGQYNPISHIFMVLRFTQS